MPIAVFAVIMSAALLHAIWNAIVKSATDKLQTTVLVTASAAAISAAVLPFLPVPATASWPYLAASTLVQIVYFLLVARTYQLADMSRTYPLMRGTAPLLVAAVTVFRMGDPLSPIAWIGITGICLGIVCIAAGGGRTQRKGIYLALLNALIIAAYTLIDGIGVRRSGTAAAYTLWIFLLSGVPLTAWALARRRDTFVPYVARHWRIGIAGGAGTAASYGLALWAMTLEPVAIVAALRETSILFGTLIAGLVLKERIGARRIIAACIIAASAALLRLA